MSQKFWAEYQMDILKYSHDFTIFSCAQSYSLNKWMSGSHLHRAGFGFWGVPQFYENSFIFRKDWKILIINKNFWCDNFEIFFSFSKDETFFSLNIFLI
jgi:hypothetical protein